MAVECFNGLLMVPGRHIVDVDKLFNNYFGLAKTPTFSNAVLIITIIEVLTATATI